MGPPVAFADRDDFKHHLKRPDLDSSGYVKRHRKTPAWKAKRSSLSLNVGTDTLYACLTPRSSACNTSLPHVPVPSRAACWHATFERSRALFTTGKQPHPGNACFSSPRGTESRQRQGRHTASPNQASAHFMLVTAASMCSLGSDARHRWS